MQRTSKRGFTLIELLVVIAIIAILAAILFPVFASAREKARQSTCASNMKQIALAMVQYVQDYDETYPQAYTYGMSQTGTACNTPGGGAAPALGCDATGIMSVSGLLNPYIKAYAVFVCPSDPNGGLVPTNFIPSQYPTPAGQFAPLNSAINDVQAPRVDYCLNEAVFPRPRGGVAGYSLGGSTLQLTVNLSKVDSSAATIELAEFGNYPAAASGTGNGGVTNKSHRPTNMFCVASSPTGAPSATAPYDTNSDMSGNYILGVTPGIMATLYAVAPTIPATVAGATTAGTYDRALYVGSGRHTNGDNFAFLDGHVKWAQIQNTLNCKQWLWGTHAYAQSMAGVNDNNVYCGDGSGTKVTVN